MDWAKEWLPIVVAALTVLGFGIGLWQFRRGQKNLRLDRVVRLHQDVTGGEVGEARDRLTTYMWHTGEVRTGHNRCWQPTFDEMNPDPAVERQASGVGDRGSLSTYPGKDTTADHHEPLRDLYKILWCFERIEVARVARALDEDLLIDLLGSHAVWWDVFCDKVGPDDTIHRQHLADLGRWVVGRRPSLREWADRDFTLGTIQSPVGPTGDRSVSAPE